MAKLTKAQKRLLNKANERPGLIGVRGHPATISCLVPAGYLEPYGRWQDGFYKITEAGRAALAEASK